MKNSLYFTVTVVYSFLYFFLIIILCFVVILFFFFARFSYRRIQFSCAAFHPLEACVATGVCGSGEIILW